MGQNISPTPISQKPSRSFWDTLLDLANAAQPIGQESEYEEGKDAARHALAGKADHDLIRRGKTKLDNLERELKHRKALCSDLFRADGPQRGPGNRGDPTTSRYNCGFAKVLEGEIKKHPPKPKPNKGSLPKTLETELNEAYRDWIIDLEKMPKKMYEGEIIFEEFLKRRS